MNELTYGQHYYITHDGEELIAEWMGGLFMKGSDTFSPRDCSNVEAVPSRAELQSLGDFHREAVA